MRQQDNSRLDAASRVIIVVGRNALQFWPNIQGCHGPEYYFEDSIHPCSVPSIGGEC
jgi:hypothetical protein